MRTLRRPIITAAQAAEKVQAGSALFVGGSGGGIQEPSTLLRALNQRFTQTHTPTQLTVMHCSGVGDRAGAGLALLASEDLISVGIGGHWGMSPELAQLAIDNKIQAYNLPQGVIAHLLRATGAGEPGLVTKIGLRTFVDPRLSGGKLNEATSKDIVSLIEIDGHELLFYKALEIDVCFIRATTADTNGNLTFEREAAMLEPLEIAMATRRNNGIVIVEVDHIVEAGSMHPHAVQVPGNLVDFITRSEDNFQTSLRKYEPGFSGEYRAPREDLPLLPPGARRLVAQRAFKEVEPGDLINLGVGIPDGVASLIGELGKENDYTFAVEQGHLGGVPAGGIEFGAVYNPLATFTAPSQFDLFNGGHLDIAFLGMAEVDAAGNVNVSNHAGGLTGSGGFINITQGTKKVVFCGTFTAGGIDVQEEDGQVVIKKEGRFEKFVDQVGHITFSGQRANEQGQEVLYVTERAVFRLGSKGLELIEVSPGIDIDKDILPFMAFKPIININSPAAN